MLKTNLINDEEWHPLNPDFMDATLPMTLWLIKYSAIEYLACHNITSIMPAHMVDNMPIEMIDKMRDQYSHALQDHLWGKRTIISTCEEWEVRKHGSPIELGVFSDFTLMQARLKDRLQHVVPMDIAFKLRAISMPMRPTPLGFIS